MTSLGDTHSDKSKTDPSPYLKSLSELSASVVIIQQGHADRKWAHSGPFDLDCIVFILRAINNNPIFFSNYLDCKTPARVCDCKRVYNQSLIG